MTDQKVLKLDEPMKLEDCDFLKSEYLPCKQDSSILDLRTLSTEEIQDFGIAFKVLDGKNNRYNIFFATQFPTFFTSS